VSHFEIINHQSSITNLPIINRSVRKKRRKVRSALQGVPGTIGRAEPPGRCLPGAGLPLSNAVRLMIGRLMIGDFERSHLRSPPFLLDTPTASSHLPRPTNKEDTMQTSASNPQGNDDCFLRAHE
jgi:hypothetical protein